MAINANELRIGNYLTIIGITPIKIDAQRILSISNGDTDYKPIPITEEWLLKFGFVKSDHYSGGYKWHNGMFYILELAKDAFYCDYTLIFSVDYVHQLQNLYFALTGTELTWQ